MSPLPLPDPLRVPLDALESDGRASWLVGRCVREALAGEEPRDFECLCAAPLEAVLAALPNAVVTGTGGSRATVPTAAGPLDVVPIGARDVGDVLLGRDFTLHAIALRPRTGDWLDPHGGRADLAAGRLRTPGVSKERLSEDPLRALRALRLVSEHGFELDPELEGALPEQAAALAAIGGRRVRVELERLLLGPHAGRALALLRSSGLERALAPDTRPDAARIVPALPADLELRLAAWLRGGRVRAALRDLRCPRDRSVRIERLLQLHPVDVGAASTREARARRLARRDELLRTRLLALREAEIAASDDEAERRSFERFTKSLGAMLHSREVAEQRAALQIGGREVMEALGCGPGATVGRALRHLAECIAEDPSRNEPATLRRLLVEWAGNPEERK
ncbi:MAG: hypothetical protein ACQGVC_22650 [Myxococcota bacterium]